MIARLDMLEKTLASIVQDNALVALLPKQPLENRKTKKFRKEFEHQLNILKIDLEAKFSSLLLTIDCSKKQLIVRPTISEYQLLLLENLDSHETLKEKIEQIKINIQQNVREKIIGTMDTLVMRLKQSHSKSEASADQLTVKVESNSSMISSTKISAGQAIKQMKLDLEKLKDIIRNRDHVLNDLIDFCEQEDRRIRQSQQSIRAQIDQAGRLWEDYKASIEERVRRIEEACQRTEASSQYLAEYSERTSQANLSVLMKMHGEVKELRERCAGELVAVSEFNREVRKGLRVFEMHQADMEKFLLPLKDAELIEKVQLNNEGIESVDKELSEVRDQLRSLASSAGQIQSQIVKLEDKLTVIPSSVRQTAFQITNIFDDNYSRQSRIDGLKEGLGTAERTLLDLQSQADDIERLRAFAVSAKSQTKGFESFSFALVNAKNHRHERIERLLTRQMVIERDISNKLEDSNESLLNQILEKSMQLDSLSVNMRERIDLFSDNLKGPKNEKRVGVIPAGLLDAVEQIDSGMSVSGEQKRLVHKEAVEFLCSLCLEFEDLSLQKAFVPDIPDTTCRILTASSQALTAFISISTDAEVVEAYLRNEPHAGRWDEKTILSRRREVLNEFLSSLRIPLRTKRKLKPETVRFKAREYFLGLASKAMDICMTKHNQVILIGKSLFGRLRIPTYGSKAGLGSLPPTASSHHLQIGSMWDEGSEDNVGTSKHQSEPPLSVETGRNRPSTSSHIQSDSSLDGSTQQEPREDQDHSSTDGTETVDSSLSLSRSLDFRTQQLISASEEHAEGQERVVQERIALEKHQHQHKTIREAKLYLSKLKTLNLNGAGANSSESAEAQPYILRGGFKMPINPKPLSQQTKMFTSQSLPKIKTSS